IHLSSNRLSKGLRAFDTRLRGPYCFLSSQKCHERVRGCDSYFELCSPQGCFTVCSSCCRSRYVRAAQAKVEGLPCDCCSNGTAPDAVQIVGSEHRTGNRGNYGLGKQQAEDVVSRCSIELRDGIDARKIGCPRQLDSCGCRIDLLLGCGNCGIVL